MAIWRNRDGARFQNYRSTFTVLDTNPVSRTWLSGVIAHNPTHAAPLAWTEWVNGRTVRALLAPPTTQHRTRAQQLPHQSDDVALLQALWAHFQNRPPTSSAAQSSYSASALRRSRMPTSHGVAETAVAMQLGSTRSVRAPTQSCSASPLKRSATSQGMPWRSRGCPPDQPYQAPRVRSSGHNLLRARTGVPRGAR